jgi:hypothetical protein
MTLKGVTRSPHLKTTTPEPSLLALKDPRIYILELPEGINQEATTPEPSLLAPKHPRTCILELPERVN